MAYCYLLASGTEAAKQNEQTISEVRAAFKKEHLELAKKALAKKDKVGLSTARQELKKLTDYGFASESEVASLRKNIDELAKSLPAEATETPTETPQTPTPTPSDNKAAKAEQVKSLVEEIKTLIATKKYDDALKKVDELKRLDGSNAEIYRLQAQIYMNKDNPDKACRAMKQYIKLVRGGGQASMFQEYMANQDTDSYPACAD
jgi:Flp pilus assembly protein TadD